MGETNNRHRIVDRPAAKGDRVAVHPANGNPLDLSDEHEVVDVQDSALLLRRPGAAGNGRWYEAWRAVVLLDDYRIPWTNRYDWDRILDGREHRLTPAVFGDVEPLEFGRHARKMCTRRGVRASIRTSSRPPLVVIRALMDL